MGFASWLLSNVLGILLVLILALFLFGVFSHSTSLAHSASHAVR